MVKMGRDEEVKSAVIDCISHLGGAGAPISNYLIGVPLVSAGFTELEIAEALIALNDNGTVELLDGNRVRIISVTD
jgi:hypothetical protein